MDFNENLDVSIWKGDNIIVVKTLASVVEFILGYIAHCYV